MPQVESIIAKAEKSNLFLCIEGIDGVGKTTVSQLFARRHGFHYYKSPSGPLARVRSIADEELDPVARFFFYRAATQHDSTVIEALLQRGPVICDRYIYSTIAYHVVMDPRIATYSVQEHLCIPDVVILLAAKEEERLRRLGCRGGASIMDKDSEMLRQVHAALRALCHHEIDTTNLSMSDVDERITEIVRNSGFNVATAN